MAINPEQYGSGTTPAKGDTKRMLLVKLVAGGGGGGVPVGAGFVFAGHYGGLAPNFTPAAGVAIADDLDTNRQWNYFGGVWH